MAFTSVTYTFTNSTTADATQVNTNFTDLINGLSDGTKDIAISALTLGGAFTVNAAATLGASTANDITFNGSLASNIPVKTNTTFDIGTATIGLRSIYIGGTSTFTTRIVGGTQSGSMTLTLPVVAPTAGQFLQSNASGVMKWASLMHLRYTNSSNQSIPNATETIITGWTLDVDAGTNFNATTGLFTAPATGVYRITVLVTSGNAANEAWSINGSIELRIQKNASANTQVIGRTQTAALSAANLSCLGLGTIPLTALDTLACSCFLSDVNGHNLYNVAAYNWITIEQVTL